ncbi:MAG TPA: hypothetical protein DD424_01695 [Porphyromonadaceae bacterium]|nr:hypothetical protein [Porphyromonadaceae bacterium]
MSKLARWAASLSPKLGARMGERVLFLQHTQQVEQKSLLRSSVERGLAGWIKNTLSLLENRESWVDITCGLDGKKFRVLIYGVSGETYGNVYLVLA